MDDQRSYVALCPETHAVKSQKHDSYRNKSVINVSVFCEVVYIQVLSEAQWCLKDNEGDRHLLESAILTFTFTIFHQTLIR